MDVTSYLLGKKSGGGSATLQEKSVTITENGATHVTADTGYDGLSKVEVTTNIPASGVEDYLDSTLMAGTTEIPGFAKTIKKLISPLTISSNTGGSLQYAFNNYSGTEIPHINGDMSTITNMDAMFRACSNVKTLDLRYFDTSNVTTMSNMFDGCQSLESLDISGFDMGKVINIRYFIQNPFARKLVNLSFGYDLGKGYSTASGANNIYYTLNLAGEYLLSHDSLVSVINGLYDIGSIGVQPQQLVLGSTNLAKLSASEIAIATNKGWTVS